MDDGFHLYQVAETDGRVGAAAVCPGAARRQRASKAPGQLLLLRRADLVVVSAATPATQLRTCH